MRSRPPSRPSPLGDLVALFPPLPTARRFKTVSRTVRVMPAAPPRVPKLPSLAVRPPAIPPLASQLPPAPPKPSPRPKKPRKNRR